VEPRPVRELERSLLQQGYFYSFASDWLTRHRGMPEQQAELLGRDADQVYREFVRFVREAQLERPLEARADGERKLGKIMESSAVSRQLESVERTLASSAGGAAKAQLQQLRKVLLDEQLTQLDSQRVPIAQDVREAVLGRLTSPTRRLFDQLSDDPQVLAALDIAKNDAKYNSLLNPSDAPPPTPSAPAAQPSSTITLSSLSLSQG